MTSRIALDAMGGDHGLPVNIEGALLARQELDHEIILVGDRPLIEQELAHRGHPNAFLIQHAPRVIGMHEKPADACRSKKDSSIMVCSELVAQGKADAFISAGNSGATMAAALWHLRRLPGVSRPAIATLMPTLVGNAVVLDVGANVDCKPKHLLQFAVMGSIYARAILDIPIPPGGALDHRGGGGKRQPVNPGNPPPAQGQRPQLHRSRGGPRRPRRRARTCSFAMGSSAICC
jgi:glycerol-3-phosphate acyltransferase PlsX